MVSLLGFWQPPATLDRLCTEKGLAVFSTPLRNCVRLDTHFAKYRGFSQNGSGIDIALTKTHPKTIF